MIGRLSQFAEPLLSRLAGVLHSLGLKPNHITMLSFCCSLAAAVAFVSVTEHLLKGISAGILLVLSGLFDATDGSMARAYGEVSRFGGFLDSVLDRVSEIIIYWSLVYSGLVDLSTGLAALSGSLLVSYARARAEDLGSEMKGIGIAERPERLLILVVAAFVGQLNAGVLLIALLTVITVAQRIMHAKSTMKDSQPSAQQ